MVRDYTVGNLFMLPNVVLPSRGIEVEIFFNSECPFPDLLCVVGLVLSPLPSQVNTRML